MRCHWQAGYDGSSWAVALKKSLARMRVVVKGEGIIGVASSD